MDRENSTVKGSDILRNLGGLNVEHAFLEVSDLVELYPDVDYESVEDDLGLTIKRKLSVSEDSYINTLAHQFYGGLHAYLDNKWLAIDGTEEIIIQRLIDVLHIIIEQEDYVDPMEFKDTVILGNELLDAYKNSGINTQIKEGIIRQARVKHARNGLDLLIRVSNLKALDLSPADWASLVIPNEMEIMDGDRVRLQLKPSIYRRVVSCLGIVEDVNAVKDKEIHQLYANIYSIYGHQTRSSKLNDVNNWVIGEALERGEGEISGFSGEQYKRAGITLFTSDKYYLIVGTQVLLFQRFDNNKRSLVFKKPLNDVRLKDIKKIVSQL